MPLPGTYDLALYRGDTYEWRFRLWSDAARTVPTDLTGATAKAEIRDKPAGLVITVLGTQITEPNIVDVTLPAGSWASMPPSSGAWDLQLTFPDGDVHTVVRGKVAVIGDVTDSTRPLAIAGRRRR